MKIKTVFNSFHIALTAILIHGSSVSAAVERYSASAVVPIKKPKPTDQEKFEAESQVKRALLSKIIASQDESRRQRLQELSGQLNPDDFFVVGTLLIADTRVDTKAKTLMLVAQVDSDSQAFDKLVDRGGFKGIVAWVFAARRQASVKEFDMVAFNRITTEQKKEESAGASSSGGKAVAQQGILEQSSVSTEGGTLRKEDSIEYRVEEHQRARIDKAMSETFKNRKIRTALSSDLQSNSDGKLVIADVLQDFKNSSDISDTHKALVMNAALAAEVDFFATGTVTINAKSRDPVTGSTRIAVTVDAQVVGFRKSSKGDRYVGTEVAASTGSKTVIAIGADQTEAENKAIEEASKVAANILSDQLQKQ